MASAQQDVIYEIAGNQELYDVTDLTKLSLEQSNRLLMLHKLDIINKKMLQMSGEFKERNGKVTELRTLLQLINKVTNHEEGDDRGKLSLTHKNLNNPNVDLAHDLTKRLKKLAWGQYPPSIDLRKTNDYTVRDLLAQAQMQGMVFEVKDYYQGQEIDDLLTAVRGITNIGKAEDWAKVQDIMELRSLLQKARDVYRIEIKWPVEEYNRDEREALTSSIDMSVKDFSLQNDLQMQDLSRLHQEQIELLQMFRAAFKTLHEDKLHKARSASGR
ncbi:MAG: hypothetical protein Q8K75_00940 [Chlamydiales bacterium]|nr:hypothetical protein [Chlamydiales bacterium]